MPRPKRDQQQIDLRGRIVAAAWEQIATRGAPALSLRAIARQIGITAPAIYHYFPDRDALVTELTIEAYTSLGDSQLAARDAVAAGDPVGRLMATGIAYRQWALTHPQHYQLIFGTPIPGYLAPAARIFPAAARSFGALVSALEALRVADRLDAGLLPQAEPGYESAFGLWKSYGGEADILSLSLALLIWARVHGLVSLEIAGSLPPFGLSAETLYQHELSLIQEQFIKD